MRKSIFQNKVVWITGASSGIGEALVYAFAQAGARLIISARNETALNNVKHNCPLPENVFILPLDLSKPHGIESAAARAMQQCDRIEYLIHNAGLAARDLAVNTTAEVDRLLMETNYFGPVALTKAVLPSMLSSGSGHIVVISSLSGKYGVPKLSAYAASKHALHGFFESLRAEVSNKGIDISIIIPGFIKTAIITNGVDGAGRQQQQRDLQVNEKGMSAEECASRILDAIAEKKQEVLIGRSEILTVYLNRFFPNLQRRLIRSHPLKKLAAIRNIFRKKVPAD